MYLLWFVTYAISTSTRVVRTVAADAVRYTTSCFFTEWSNYKEINVTVDAKRPFVYISITGADLLISKPVFDVAFNT